MESIYAEYENELKQVQQDLLLKIEMLDKAHFEQTGERLFEHVVSRIKSDESMREKCRKKGLPETAESALMNLHDAIGIRIVCSFMDDIYIMKEKLSCIDGVEIIQEKDYIRHAKANGYRSFHLILRIKRNDAAGSVVDAFFVEIQLRTIAMDTWAALEHRMKYKKDIRNQEMIVAELKRCADELAGCDLSMQTIRELIRES